MPFRVLISKRAVIVELLFRSEIKWLDGFGPTYSAQVKEENKLSTCSDTWLGTCVVSNSMISKTVSRSPHAVCESVPEIRMARVSSPSMFVGF